MAIKFDGALFAAMKGQKRMRIFSPEELALIRKARGGGTQKTASGNPIIFTGKNIISLKAFGNHGKHKADKLWGRYVPCDGITNASSTSIDTGVKAVDNMEMFVRFKAITGSFYILQARETGSGKIYGISGGQSGNTINAYGVTSGISRTNDHIYTVKMTMVNRAVTLYVKDETTGQEDTKTGTASASDYSFPSPTTIKLYGDASLLASGVTVYRAYIKINGQMAWDMYPCVDVVDGNKTVAYDDVTHEASVKVSGSFTSEELIQPISYAESDGTVYCDTGIIPTTFDYTITYEGAIKKLTAGPNCAWGYMGGNGNLPRWVCAGYSNNYLLNANTTSAIQGADTNNHTFVGKVYEKNGSPYWLSEIDGQVKQNDQTLPNADTWATNTLSIYLFARHNADGAGNTAPATMKRWICEKNGVVIKHYIPVRIGQTVELLDLVSWTFATRTGTFTAGADIPYTQICPDILCCSTGDIYYGVGKNLFDGTSNIVLGKYINSNDGAIGTSATNFYCETYFECKPSTSYAFWGERKTDGVLSKYNRVHFYDNNKDFISSASYVVGAKTVVVSPSNARFVRISCNVLDSGTLDTNTINQFNWYLGEGTASTEYTPYHFGTQTDGSHKVKVSKDGTQIAERNIPMLLSTDSYLDIQNGQKSEAWGIKVLTGTENWSVASEDYPHAFKSTTVITNRKIGKSGVASHFITTDKASDLGKDGYTFFGTSSQTINFSILSCDTVADFKSWLADQYAKGTPVIILYPLATPTTESVSIAPISLTEKAEHTVVSVGEIETNMTIVYK